MYKRILLAYDGSEPGQRALLDSLDIAKWSKAEVHLVAVMPHLASTYAALEGGLLINHADEQHERERYERILADGITRLTEAGVVARGEVLVGDSVERIVACARKIEADLIVVGHKHLDSWAERWWRGSTSAALIEHAPCNVLVAIIR
jgi:nucleotide-binding universal stress UspA family protein